MKRLSDCIGRELLWTKRSPFSGESELRDGDELCGTLRWPIGFRPAAEGETEEGRWIFRRRGFLHGRVLILPADSDTEVATFRSSWRDQTLEFEDGRQVKWRRESFWGGIWRFDTAEGVPLLRLRRRARLLRACAALEIEPAAARHRDLPLLALLGWYLILRQRRRSHAH